MKMKYLVRIITAIGLAIGLVVPVFAQFGRAGEIEKAAIRNDRAAIKQLMDQYETAFNARKVDLRMALCLKTYYEYGFEQGKLILAKNYEQTKRDVGRYWAGLPSLKYSLEEEEIIIDGPQAFVRAYTTHVAPKDNHTSIVHFALVKIDGRWWIAWDSYNIIHRY